MTDNEGRRPGVPTSYGGVHFRSMLEARWAAAFDLLKWRWTYEPFGLKDYIPDFLLHFKTPLLVEVKPATAYEELAQYEAKIQRSGWTGDYLVLGAGFVEERSPDSHAEPTLGLVSQRTVEYGPCDVHKRCRADCPKRHAVVGDPCSDRALFHRCLSCGQYSLHHESASWRCYVNGCYDGDHYLGLVSIDQADALWRDAGNKVQWKGASAKP